MYGWDVILKSDLQLVLYHRSMLLSSALFFIVYTLSIMDKYVYVSRHSMWEYFEDTRIVDEHYDSVKLYLDSLTRQLETSG